MFIWYLLASILLAGKVSHETQHFIMFAWAFNITTFFGKCVSHTKVNETVHLCTRPIPIVCIEHLTQRKPVCNWEIPTPKGQGHMRSQISSFYIPVTILHSSSFNITYIHIHIQNFAHALIFQTLACCLVEKWNFIIYLYILLLNAGACNICITWLHLQGTHTFCVIKGDKENDAKVHLYR